MTSTSPAHIRVNDSTLRELAAGTRNALLVSAAIPIAQGEIVRMVDDEGKSLDRRVLFVDASAPGDHVLIGLMGVGGAQRDVARRRASEALQGPAFRLQLARDGEPLSGAQRADALEVLFSEIIDALGVERFGVLPIEVLDQFSVMSLVRNHDTRGMLVSLIHSFMAGYCTPQTHVAAYQCLQRLEQLRGDVIAARVTPDLRSGPVVH